MAETRGLEPPPLTAPRLSRPVTDRSVVVSRSGGERRSCPSVHGGTHPVSSRGRCARALRSPEVVAAVGLAPTSPAFQAGAKTSSATRPRRGGERRSRPAAACAAHPFSKRGQRPCCFALHQDDGSGREPRYRPERGRIWSPVRALRAPYEKWCPQRESHPHVLADPSSQPGVSTLPPWGRWSW